VTPFQVHASGTPNGTPIVLLHGFLSDHRMWRTVCAAHPEWCSLGLDLPGHGDAARARCTGSQLTATLAQWIATLDALPVLVGYSMGGRVLRQLLVNHPVAHRGALLIGTHAGYSPAEGLRRQKADDQLAHDLEQYGVVPFVERWEQLPVFAGQPPSDGQRALRLDQNAEGLAASLRSFGSGTCSAGGERKSTGPIQLIFGDRLGADAVHAKRLARDWPDAQRVPIEGVGHNPVLECPERVGELIASAAAGA
jgi:2-succinyl-6-hydroxy-2,4-cyclohexadiene-1-carboxylate synthase